ncbi:MAG: malonyl-CoA decarboxylase [Vicinamibacterales bacterium]
MATRFGSFLGRTTNRPFLARMLRSLSGDASRSVSAPDAIALCRALLSEHGELSGTRMANDVVEAYGALDADGLEQFFDLLAREFSADPEVIDAAASAYKAVPSQANLTRLQHAVEPARQELFRRINVATSGIAALLDMRRTILRTLRDHPDRAGIDADLVHLFRSWFNRGFLRLQRIDWRTSALILERLIQYEAVHQIQGWDDLRRRLDADRRCYAFFHPALPDEPLIFIEIALTRGMPAAIQPLLALSAPPIDPSSADSAIFYSITNCQEGLRGISFGSFLIKQVVEDLTRTFPALDTFATLSPVPGFADWLAAGSLPWALPEPLAQILSRSSRGDAAVDPAALEPLRDEVMRLCAYYLLHAKRGDAPLDPVARFHLANGARMERLNWMGDVSATGMRRALGLTVNYVYGLADVEKHHDAYAREYRIVASRDLERLAQPPARRGGRPRQHPARGAAGRPSPPRS